MATEQILSDPSKMVCEVRGRVDGNKDEIVGPKSQSGVKFSTLTQTNSYISTYG